MPHILLFLSLTLINKVVYSGYDYTDYLQLFCPYEQGTWDNYLQRDFWYLAINQGMGGVIGGIISQHDNNKNDRRYKFTTCAPNPPYSWDKNAINIHITQRTEYDEHWIRGCGGNTAISGVRSLFDKGKKDRVFEWRCAYEFDNEQYILKECKWDNNYVNNFDEFMRYRCENTGVIRSIESYHNNHPEDRRFKFECCRFVRNYLTYAQYQFHTFPYYWANDLDGPMIVNARPNSFINGLYSYHSNQQEDRKFKWSESEMIGFSGIKGVEIIEKDGTPYDKEWEIGCKTVKNGNSGIIGIESYHSNHHEDRTYKNIKCGLLHDEYSMSLCGYTGYLNNLDGRIDFSCPYGGVIRSIWSKHNNHAEDRIYRFECCQVIKGGDFLFKNKRGYWKEVQSCYGCPTIQYRLTIGITQTQTIQETKEFSTSFTTSITAGYTFGKPGASKSVSITKSSTLATSTATAVSDSVTKSHQSVNVITCDKMAIYQWIQYGYEAVNSLDTQVESSQYVCSDFEPKCVVGDCKLNTQCQICKSSDNE